MTGYSGSGKSTLASEVARRLPGSVVLDGDEIRRIYGSPPHGAAGVETTTERVIELSLAHFKSKQCVVAAFVAPREDLRDRVRQSMQDRGIRFIEVFVKADIEVCALRDVKGLYRRLNEGEDIRLAGINEPFDIPKAPEIICETGISSLDENVSQIIEAIKGNV
jgi:adenylylsulfate kinase-like enzyme